MTTTKKNKLKSLYAELPPGAPVSSSELARLGISADLAVHYVRAGWLLRLARGVFCRPEQGVALYPSLKFLENRIQGFHVGGKTALDWHGVRHYVLQVPTLHLYGWTAARLPAWFLKEFSGEYHRKRIFEEHHEALLHVAPYEGRDEAPLVSSPERALLEVLSEVGVRQPLQEARELMEGAYTLRGAVLQELLTRCNSIKTVRLCLQLGSELSLPWMAKVSREGLRTGSDRPWVSRGSQGVLVLDP